MKGLRHNVIEIKDTENDNIEKILVFLKPHAGDVALMTTRAEATELLKELEVKKCRPVLQKKWLWSAVAVAVAALLLLTVMFI